MAKNQKQTADCQLALDGGKPDSVDGWHNKDSLLMILTQFHSQSVLRHVPPPDPKRQSAFLENWRNHEKWSQCRIDMFKIISGPNTYTLEKHLFHLHLILKELRKHQCNICTYIYLIA